MNSFTHIDNQSHPCMVDVSAKKPQFRVAKARGQITLAASTIDLIQQNQISKGNVLTVAEIAGIQAAKRTPEWIPLCHPIPLSNIQVKSVIIDSGIEIQSEVSSIGQTGVEMEALTAVSAALLTIYDMCKAVDKKMVIEKIILLEKTKNDVE